MFVRENQVTPFHYHVRKTEDIINRGGKGTGKRRSSCTAPRRRADWRRRR